MIHAFTQVGVPASADTCFQENDTTFVTEASALHWPPGVWPQTVATSLGNGADFARVRLTGMGANYRQPGTGLILQVFNT